MLRVQQKSQVDEPKFERLGDLDRVWLFVYVIVVSKSMPICQERLGAHLSKR